MQLRLPEAEYAAFDLVCREKGYSKTGKIRELIRKLVQLMILLAHKLSKKSFQGRMRIPSLVFLGLES